MALLTTFFAFPDFSKSRKINRLQTKKDSIPIAVKFAAYRQSVSAATTSGHVQTA